MKKFLTLCLLSFYSLSSFCQHSQLRLSDDFKIAEKEYRNQTVTHSIYHNNSFYTATNSGSGLHSVFVKLYDAKFAVFVSKFDKNMEEIKKVELENGNKIFGPLEPELFLLNSKLCLAYFQSDNSSSFNLYLALIDENNLTLTETKKICTIQQENVGIFKMASVIEAGFVSIANSSDNTKALLVCKPSPNTIHTFVVDDNLNVVHQTTLHTTATEFHTPSAVLTNDDVECLILESKEETRVICISPDGKKTETKINAVGNLFPDLTHAIQARDGKRIYIYSSTTESQEDGKGSNGLLIQQLDCSTLKLSRALAYEFSPEFIETIYKNGGGSKHKKDYFMFHFTPNLIELDNGTIVIMGGPEEESSSTTSQMSYNMDMQMQMRTTATTRLEVGPLIAFFPDKNGKTFEYELIPRKSSFVKAARSGSGAIQMVQSPGISHSYSDFIGMNIGDEILVLYNDDEENLKKGTNEKTVAAHSPKNLVVAEALIGKDGKLQYRKQIGENLKGNYAYFLGNVIPTSSSSIIFPIGKEGMNFNARKMFYSNWCFLDIK
jgi:hypothetical protein